MVHRPTRGDAAPRLGETVVALPSIGGSRLDADVYRDPARFERERTSVLRSSWLIAGRSSELSHRGDWLVYEGHGETVIVVRRDTGSVGAFHNVCQHRGARLSRGASSGCDRRFVCPWHGWVYDTDGVLVGVPERDDFDPGHLADLRIPSVAADEWGGWIWINLAGESAPPLLEWIGPEIVDDLGRFHMEDMVLHDKLVYELDVNWKVVVDGFNEVYHVTELHHVDPEFTRAARDTSFHLSGPNSMMFVPRHQHRDALAATGDHHRYAICHYVVFPNSVFNNNPDQVQLFQPIPLSVDRTRFVCWDLAYGPEGADDAEWPAYERHRDRRWKELRSVIEEDIFIFGEVGATSASMARIANIFSGRECKPTAYHRIMEHCVAGGSAMDLWSRPEIAEEASP